MNLSPVCIKRLISEYKKIIDDPIHNCIVYMDEDKMLDWYVLMYNMDGDYTGGEYILKILMSPKYPFAPPDFMILTPSGRFTHNQKLCFSNSGYHSNEWSPLWNMSTIIIGFMSMFLDKNTNGIGHISDPSHIKIKYAKDSINFNKKYQSNVYNHLIDIRKTIINKVNDNNKERLEQTKLEENKLEKERLEQIKLEQERLKQIKLEQEKLEQERLKQIKLEQERLEEIRLEEIRLEEIRLEEIRLEEIRLEKKRLEEIRLEEIRLEKEIKIKKYIKILDKKIELIRYDLRIKKSKKKIIVQNFYNKRELKRYIDIWIKNMN